MLDVSEDGFDLGGAPAAELLALLGEQILVGLLAKFLQVKTDPDMTVALGPSAVGFEWAVRAVQSFEVAGLDRIAVVTLFMPGVAISQRPIGRTGKGIAVRVIGETLRPEALALDEFRFAMLLLLTMEARL